MLNTSTKILILGANGMLGGYLAEVFSDLDPVLRDKNDLDITDCDAVRKRITELKPDIIINAAAYTAVDDCEKNLELANRANGYAVTYLIEAADKVGAALVHYSTDYVFEGRSLNGYKEDNLSQNPINAYGGSKLIGERYILNTVRNYGRNYDRNYVELQNQSIYPLNPPQPSFNKGGSTTSPFRKGPLRPRSEARGPEGDFKYYIIRTSWLYGRGGNNFVDTMLKLAETNKELKVVNDQHGKPTYARDLAKRTRELLEGNYMPGIYHITDETENEKAGITWFDFATEIFSITADLYGLRRINTDKVKILPCSSVEFPRTAKRPEWSALVNTKLPKSRNWKEALREYLLIGSNRGIIQSIDNEEMNREIYPKHKGINKEVRSLTAAVFRVTEKFAGGEVLKNKIQERALNVFAKSNPHFDNAAVKDINILNNFLRLAKDLKLTKAINCDVLIREYDRLLDSIEASLRGASPLEAGERRGNLAEGVSQSAEQRPAQAATGLLRRFAPRNDSKILTARQKKILKLFKNKKDLRLKDMSLIFSDVTPRTLRSDLKGLIKTGYLAHQGLGAGSVYKIKS